ncbi:MAG: alkaline phosphatase [Bacteroidales bacterium]|nr:alkaline phosphatase [Bacteroidales bacterium]
MKRRTFIQTGMLSAMAGTMFPLAVNAGKPAGKFRGKTKNIIFMVSDGMSHGTLNMADLFLQRKEQRSSNWIRLYRENKVTRALMDTSSANSLVTDSAAASSAWGGGKKVNNGSLNVNADGSFNKPILQQFKEAGKAVGCVTTVPITHATPAGFCVNVKSRDDQAAIASLYLPLKFDVMMGGGFEYFSDSKRKDSKDLFEEFRNQSYQVALTSSEMKNTSPGKPLLGVFYEDGLPYSLDHLSDPILSEKVPTLAAMTQKAIELMSANPNGFVLQVEGGKVDWAAHANDAAGLIYDQIAFDDAIKVAVDFAEKDKNTLVIITTDHGNSNPGLIKSKNVDQKFETLLKFKQTNDWVLYGINKDFSVNQVIERIYEAQQITITEIEAMSLLEDYTKQDNSGIYNAYKLPFRKFAQIQQNYTSIGWSGMDHSADFVELAMFGPGSAALKPFVSNTELHSFMLEAAK